MPAPGTAGLFSLCFRWLHAPIAAGTADPPLIELDETTTCRGSFEQAAVKATVAITITEAFVSIRHHNVCMAPCHSGSDRAPAALPNVR